jgi:RNA polymerase sigma factor (sigma-70 family)
VSGSFSRWGDEEFELFYKETLRQVYARARTLCGSPEEAEDLMHSAYVEALCSPVLGGLEPRQQLSWMYTTVTRMASRDWRRNKRFEELAPSLYEPHHSDAPDPADAALAALDTEMFLKALGRMSWEKRVIAVLRWVDGYNAAEIAEILQMKHGTVRRLIKEIRDYLLRLLGREL